MKISPTIRHCEVKKLKFRLSNHNTGFPVSNNNPVHYRKSYKGKNILKTWDKGQPCGPRTL